MPIRLSLLLAALVWPITISPMKAGDFPVASTFFKIRDVDPAKRQGMLCGANKDGSVDYVDELLVDPQATRHAHVADPGRSAGLGTTFPFYYFVLYPTTPENHHPDVTMFDHFVLPRMDGPGEQPILAPSSTRFPIIAFSHGYNVHPFYDLPNLIALAANGYVVIGIFHGDGRFTRGPLQAETAKIRARSVSACVNDLLADRAFATHVDASRLGVFGISRGGNTAARLVGAVSRDRDASCSDSRFVVAVGESPAISEFDPEEDLDFSQVTAPYFAIDGSEDTLQATINRVLPTSRGPSLLVQLPGQGHVPTDQVKERVITPWLLDFFAAYLYQNQTALDRVASRNAVPGDITNRVVWRKHLPTTVEAQP